MADVYERSREPGPVFQRASPADADILVDCGDVDAGLGSPGSHRRPLRFGTEALFGSANSEVGDGKFDIGESGAPTTLAARITARYRSFAFGVWCSSTR